MYINKVVLPFGKGRKTTRTAYSSCWHIGNPAIHWEGIAKFLQRAKKMPWWHVGDLLESIMPGDKRFNVNEHKATLLENIALGTNHVSKANKTCWGLIMGNHERKCSSLVGDISETIAHDSKVPYLGTVAALHVHAPKGESTILTAHGSGSVRRNSGIPERDDINMRINLRRKLDIFNGVHLKAVGHYHKTIVAPMTMRYRGRFTDSRMKRALEVADDSWCVAAPSMFLNYTHDSLTSSYAEAALYPPTDIGWIEIVWNIDGSIACIDSVNEKGKIVESFEPVIIHT
jgi:hypothetical protein